MANPISPKPIEDELLSRAVVSGREGARDGR